MRKTEDERIVELFLVRDENAVKETSLKYGKSLRFIANNFLNNISDAEECENETYLKAWDTIPPNEPRTYLFSYLARITRFSAINMLKSRNAEKRCAAFCELADEALECLPESFTAEQYADSDFLSELINSFLHTLPEEKCNIFIRRYWFGDSIASIADRYSVSTGKVKSTLFRVRNELKQYLIKEGYRI